MKRGIVIGAAVATGAIMLIPGVAQALARAGRPLTQAGMKTGAYAYKEFQKAGAEVYEHFEDLAAEFRAEVDDRDDQNEETAPDDWDAEITDLEAHGATGGASKDA